MEYFHLCINCKKPTPDRTVNVVLVDVENKEEKKHQYYCSECFKSVTFDVIAKHQKAAAKNKKTKTKN